MRLFAVSNATALLLASPLQAQTFVDATRWQIWGAAHTHAHVVVAGVPSDGAVSVSAPLAEDVTIASDPGVALAATLRTPSGSRRHLVVLLLAGGGAWPRGGARAADAGLGVCQAKSRHRSTAGHRDRQYIK